MASEIELLIELVRARPCLYDKTHHAYKDSQGVRSNNWQDITQAMISAGYDSYTVILDLNYTKAKWENLRDSYNGARKRHAAATRSGSAADKTPTWPYWSQMAWLDQFLKRIDTTSNVPDRSNIFMPPPPPSLYHESEDSIFPAFSRTTTPVDTTPSPTTSTNTDDESINPPRKKRSRQMQENNDDEFLSKIGSMVDNIMMRPGGNDPSDNFGQMMSAQHRSLTAEQQKFFLLECQNAYVRALQYQPPSTSYHDL